MANGKEIVAQIEKKYCVTLPAEYRRFLAEEAFRAVDGRYPGEIPHYEASNGGPRLFFLFGDDVEGHPEGKGFHSGRGRAEIFPGATQEEAKRFVPFSALVSPKDRLMEACLAVDVTAGEAAPVYLFINGEFKHMADGIGEVLANLRTADQAPRLEVLKAAITKAEKLIEKKEHQKAIDVLSPALALFDGRKPAAYALEVRFKLANAYVQRSLEAKALGDFALAEADALRALAIDEKNGDHHAVLAWCYYDFGRFPESIRAAETGLKLITGMNDNQLELLLANTLSELALGHTAAAEKCAMRIQQDSAYDKSWMKRLLEELAAVVKDHPDRAERAKALIVKLGGPVKSKPTKAANAAKAKPVKIAAHTFTKKQKAMLAAHAAWVKSKGKKGEQFSAHMLEAFADGEGRPILRGAFLAQADLQSADFEGCEVDFSGCDLTGALFSASNFLGSNFDGARLVGVNFDDTTFEGSTFRGADFSGADLQGADAGDWGEMTGATYDDETQFGSEFEPDAAGMTRKR